MEWLWSSDIKKFIVYAKSIGFEWGGDWTGFVDQPHLQFNYKGYGTDTFGKKASSAPSKSTNSGIKSVGKIKNVGVSNAAIIMDKPDRIKAKNVGAIGLDKTIVSLGLLEVQTILKDTGRSFITVNADMCLVSMANGLSK